MRTLLKDYVGKTITCEAWVSHYGYKLNALNYPEDTILLKDIILLPAQEYLSDHIWFPIGDVFSDLKRKEIIQFSAIVKQYFRRKKTDNDILISSDYKLIQPRNIKRLSSNLTSRPTTLLRTDFTYYA